VTLFTLLIFLLCIWSLALYTGRLLREDMEQLLGGQQLSSVAMVASGLNTELEDRLQALRTVASEIGPADLKTPARLQTKLEQRVIFQQQFNDGSIVTDLGGTVLADFPRTSGRMGVNYAERDSIAAALKQGRTSIGRPVMGKKSAAPMLAMTVPIFDPQGLVIGSLSGVINLARPNFLDTVAQSRYGQASGYSIVARQHRVIVTSADKSRIMSTLPGPGVVPMIDRAMQGFEGSVVYVSSPGVERLAAVKAIPAADWFLVASLPTQEAFAPIHHLQQQVLLITLALTLMAGALIWWMLRRELSPLLSTVKSLALLAGSRQPPQPLPITRQDEIGELITGFNHLLHTLAQRERAMREVKESYRALADWTPEAILVHRLGKILFVNPAAVRLFGASSAQQLVGHQTLELIHPDFRDSQTARMQAIIDRGAIEPMVESRFLRLDGTVIDVEVQGTSVTYVGAAAILVSVRDITARKRTADELNAARAAAENANRAKSRLLAAVSHDLRQPLSAISLFASVLDTSTVQQSDVVGHIQDSVARLSELLSDLLDVSKLEAGVISPSFHRFTMDAFLAGLLAPHAVEAARKQLRLRLRCCQAVVHTDELLLRRIVGNIVSNAVRYTEHGGVLLACRHRQGCLWLEVWDTGVGIPEDQTQLVFEEFTQLTDDSRNQGSGLGLAIVARMAGLLGLEMRLQSRPGHGSMFAVRLPEVLAPPDAEPVHAVQPVQPLRIALVEDNPDVLQALVLSLEFAGHEVVGATSGRELLQRLGAQAPDVLISDFRLAAGATGLDVIDAVREVFSAALPAFIITGDTDAPLIRRLAKRGIQVVFKPLQIDSLLASIQAVSQSKAQ
jgi:PAS domain S-box-containing protein